MITQPPPPPLIINQQRLTLSARNFNSFLRQQPVYNHQIQHPLITNNGSGITVGGNPGSMIEDSIWATQTVKHLKIIPSDADDSKWFSRWSHRGETMTFHHHCRQ
ncbi:hypothetical protein LINGRAHAP2_LOCUS35739 [Linum grandiflorum]